ncbi:MAG TPA: Rrf2 family transcriptional regulator [Ignavibacteriaceae bacterium]|nr:Rrf2 family transcriptional regulator [Ignavibacteriaceae bacterium]
MTNDVFVFIFNQTIKSDYEMTVIFSKKCEYGLQAVLYLAAKNNSVVISSEEISDKLNIPKEFISKILQGLTESGLVYSKKGKSGGFALAKEPKKIRLIDIVTAIDGLGMFDNCVLGFPQCSPDHPCPLHEKWGALRTNAYNMLTEETLDQLKEKTLKKIGYIGHK